MSEVKTTKKEYFAILRNLVESFNDDQYDGLLAFIDKEVANLDSRAAKAKERAEKKKAEGDELKEKIFNVLTAEPQTGNEIIAELDVPDVSKQKLAAKLSVLIKEGRVIKDTVKDGKKRTMVYKLADTDEVEA